MSDTIARALAVHAPGSTEPARMRVVLARSQEMLARIDAGDPDVYDPEYNRRVHSAVVAAATRILADFTLTEDLA